ncbi:hypothetical protein C8Q75DRAFT_806056 [Abortiporus biennis]|nr:hypothetical protein C8Q75DRAFT_806056 [Abortiporus biennis]
MDKLLPARPAYAAHPHPHALPLSVSTTSSFSPSPASPASPSLPSATSSFYSRHISRSPLITSPRPLPSPVPRSPHPLKSNLPSVSVSSTRSSSFSSTIVDVLSQGDLVGEGLPLQGEIIRRVPIGQSSPSSPREPQSPVSTRVVTDYNEPAREFEVVRKLGTGSYAVVYLVREVLYRSPPSDDGHCAAVGKLDLDESYFNLPGRSSVEYGQEYAVKVLSKANLDEDALDAQLFEATIHQSLRTHPNIVTLHRTLETSAFLLLLLEFVPGEDLFYFLEQARDHYESDPSLPLPVSPSQSMDMDMEPSTSPPSSDSSHSSTISARTPPTPSLLSSLNPNKMLSRTRLKLIASMFSQMCDAVAACHEQSVFHRDIKPENFIVTDGWSVATGKDGKEIRERKVVVKLTDFGLSTKDLESADMDCGSAPYMSFECRNNIHPTYSPRAADVWSLGIVLINMLYHYNPWSDTTEGVCPSFELYRKDPINFFMNRFAGMTLPVAEFLATKVFCILDDYKDDSPRVEAKAFGRWVRDLPDLLAPTGRGIGHQRNLSITSTMGYRLASIPHSRRPSLRLSTRQSSSHALDPTQRASWALSRAPSSLGPAYEVPSEENSMDLSSMMLPPVLDQEAEQEQEIDQETEAGSRSASTHKRRKRGARKGKGGQAQHDPKDETLNTLAEASQALARELSRTSRSSSLAPSNYDHHSVALPSSHHPYTSSPLHHHQLLSPSSNSHSLPSPSHLSSSVPSSATVTTTTANASISTSTNYSIPPNSSSSSASATTAPAPAPTPQPASISKKSSRWKLSFSSKGSQSERSNSSSSKVPTVDEAPKSMSTTASKATSLIMGLNAPQSSDPRSVPGIPPAPSVISLDDAASVSSWNARGRKPRSNNVGGVVPGSSAVNTWGPAGASSAFGATGPYAHSNNSNSSWGPAPSTLSTSRVDLHAPAPSVASGSSSGRAISPSSMRSGKYSATISSLASNNSNWRSSMSSLGAASVASGSTGKFTKYSNGSSRSVSTAATSVSSASSWRSSNKYPYTYDMGGQLPPNVKLVTGIPWELDQLPRQMHPNPEDVRFGTPPVRKRRAPKSKDSSGLGTIDEWPNKNVPSPLGQRADASTSTTDLDRASSNGDHDGSPSSPRKVQKGQINALAKMLSALRR